MSGIEHKYEFEVAMACNGCSSAVDRVIQKLPGLKSHEVRLQDQKAIVIADDTLAYQTVYDTIAKTNKKILQGIADKQVMHAKVAA